MIINLHLLDACNYSCGHCFARFGANKMLHCGEWKNIIDNILSGIDVERFNLAGGEPLLYSSLAELSDYIRSKGSAVSIITNGYGLTNKKIDTLQKNGISTIGISIDSPNAGTLRKLGRCTASGDILDPGKCVNLCRYIKKKGMTLKINSVISKLNYNEDFNAFINGVLPDRWKLLKIKKFNTNNFDNSSLLINDFQFENFLQRHREIPHIAEKTMENAYIMVDAFGNLIDTGSYNNKPIANLLKTSFKDAFLSMKFDYSLYQNRYAA